MSVTQDIVRTKAFVGHPKNQSNPKTRDAWLGVYNQQVVFDPSVIEEQLNAAKKAVQETKKRNQDILVICEKELFKWEIATLAENAGVHYLNYKVPAWVLTNFDTLLSRVRSLQEMRAYVESESFDTLTKKEQSMKKRALNKIEKVYKGVVNLRKVPWLVIIVDGQLMHKFVHEVVKMNVDSVLLVSSNFDMLLNSNVVNCNVNSYTSIEYVLKYILS